MRRYEQEPVIRFRTPAPADSPEVKGYRRYFRPEWLEWVIRNDDVRVCALGPPTRTSTFPGEMWWSVEGRRGDDRPPWLVLPVGLLAAANLALGSITREWEAILHEFDGGAP